MAGAAEPAIVAEAVADKFFICNRRLIQLESASCFLIIDRSVELFPFLRRFSLGKQKALALRGQRFCDSVQQPAI